MENKELKFSEIKNPKLVLCLSGGGLRATFFHLGVIKGLREIEINGEMALKSVKEIYSVSGGSILAAHLITNWDDYCDKTKKFEKIAKKLIVIANRDIRGCILRRWILSMLTIFPRVFGCKRVFFLEREYKRLFGKKSIESFYCENNSNVQKPQLHILTTTFNTGEVCSFSRDGFEMIQRRNEEVKRVVFPSKALRLSFAVTASSAFPPFFPPVTFTQEMLSDIGFRARFLKKIGRCDQFNPFKTTEFKIYWLMFPLTAQSR